MKVTINGIPVVLDRLAVHHATGILVSVVGAREAVYATYGAYQRAQGIALPLNGQTINVHSPSPVRGRFATLARGVVHGLFVRENLSEYYLVLEPDNPDLTAEARWLSNQIGLPILPHWVPEVRKLLPNQALTSWRMEVYYLPRFRVEEVKKAVQSAVRKGHLTLP
jgi:hypothetical protein